MLYNLTTLLTGGKKMPDIFKALASITAWALFILGWVTGLSTLISGITTGCLYGSQPPPMVIPAMFTLGAAELVLAVVVMRLRQKME